MNLFKSRQTRYLLGLAAQLTAIVIVIISVGQGCGQFTVGDISNSSFRWVDDGRGSLVQWVPSKRQLRLLNPKELSNTISDLTGFSLSESIQ